MPDFDTKEMHEEVKERDFCLGQDCKDKNCRICPAAGNAKRILDITDDYRKKVKGGYYTKTIMEVTDENGNKHYVYVRPD